MLVTSLLHEARMVCSVRALDTGGSRDVGGVVRITGGGGAVVGGDEDDGEDGAGEGQRWEEGEWLWEAKRDGGVRVWERGAE